MSGKHPELAPAYAMSKHDVVAYSQAWRLEPGHAITVSTVCPGNIKTPIHRDSIECGLENISPLVGWVILRQLGQDLGCRSLANPSHPVAQFAQRLPAGGR